MPNFELVLLFDPYLEDDAYSALLERTKDLITKRGGEIVNVDVWGRRRLAYPIAKKVEAYYVVVSFAGNPQEAALSEVTRALRLNERVLRVMLTRLPDLTKKEEKMKKAKTEKSGEVSSSGEASAVTA